MRQSTNELVGRINGWKDKKKNEDRQVEAEARIKCLKAASGQD